MSLIEEFEPRPVDPAMTFLSRNDPAAAVAGCITHEFNNLLAGLLLAISAVKMSLSTPEEALRQLERAEEEVDRGREIIGMLDALRDDRILACEPIPVTDLAATLESHGLYSTVSFNTRALNPSLSIPGDRTALPRAFRFLAGYILRADRCGNIGVRVTGQWMADGNVLSLPPGTFVRFALERSEDAGQPDYSEDALVPSESGTDLALAAGQSLIRRHGGAVMALRRENRFAGLSVYLPGYWEQRRTAEPAHPVPLTHSGRILLMDDEESIRTIAEILFSKLGFEITTVSDGGDAVRAYVSACDEGRPFRVVIMDLTVPWGMGGKEAMARLREIDPEVRAIVSSGYSADPVMARFEEYGFRAAVEKPYRLETLVDAVRRLL